MIRHVRALSLVLVATSIAACSARGVVGITSSKARERDAMTAPADTGGRTGAGRTDAGRSGAGSSDANARGGVVSIDDCLPMNAANLDPASAQRLIDGSGSTAGMRFLYPYEGTVYPQGIPGPVVMWDGPPSDIVYVRLHSSGFDYRGCLRATANRLELPPAVWDAAAASAKGAADPFTLELKISGETIYGPISEQLVIANGTLAGSIYYMTTTGVAAVVRVRAGRPADAFPSAPNCTGCHSASANGTRFLAYSAGFGSSFTLSSSSVITPLVAPTPGGEFAGIYPDGSVYVACAHPLGGGMRTYGGSVVEAALYDTATGALIPNSGVPTGASMPSFSPDGAHLAFTDFGASAGHTLAQMRFSIATRAASEYRKVYSTDLAFVGWPAFLPDGNGIVFTQGDSAAFSGLGVGLSPGHPPGPLTELFIADVASGTATLLSQAMGFRSADDLAAQNTYLPGGAADLHQSYYPTVSPAASGGYAWAFFDSTRSYGNQPAHRAIWGTAISLSPDGTYVTDPSHPAFYLPGQNAATPNFRSVAVLDP
jgi:hypothetical protein